MRPDAVGESAEIGRGTTTMAYESGWDRVKSVTDPVTGTTGYHYNLYGERTSVALPGGGSFSYTYNEYNPSEGTHYYTMPKDDPNSLSYALTRITDESGRRVDIIPHVSNNQADGGSVI